MADDFTLSAIHADIEARYAGVQHIDAIELVEMDTDDLVLFDVREADEYAVSHLAGALRLDPAVDADDFLLVHGDRLQDKTVIFYCSVGHRSSAKLEELGAALAARGVAAAYNLEQGIFGWRNESRALVRDGQHTDYVHPYNRHWGRLIDDESAVRYE